MHLRHLQSRVYLKCELEDLKEFQFDFLNQEHLQFAQYCLESSLYESDGNKLIYILNLEDKDYHFLFYQAVCSAIEMDRPSMLSLILDHFPGRLLPSSLLRSSYKNSRDECTKILLVRGASRFIAPSKCISIAASIAESENDPLILTSFLAPYQPRSHGIVSLLENYILNSMETFKDAILRLPCFMYDLEWAQMNEKKVARRKKIRSKVGHAISKNEKNWLTRHHDLIDQDFAVHFIKLAIKSMANESLEVLAQCTNISNLQIAEVMRTVHNTANVDALLSIFHHFYPTHKDIPFIHWAIKTCDYLSLNVTVAHFIKLHYKPTYEEIVQMIRVHRDFAVAIIIPNISRHLSYPVVLEILPIAFRLKKMRTVKALLRLMQDAPRFHSTRRLVFEHTFGEGYHKEPEVLIDRELLQLMISAVDVRFRLNHQEITDLHNILENRIAICAGLFYLLVRPFCGDDFDVLFNQFTHFSGNADALLEHVVSSGALEHIDQILEVDPDVFLLEPITGYNLIVSAPDSDDGRRIKSKIALLMWNKIRLKSKLDLLLLGHLFDPSSTLSLCGFRDVIFHVLDTFMQIKFAKRRSRMLKFA